MMSLSVASKKCRARGLNLRLDEDSIPLSQQFADADFFSTARSFTPPHLEGLEIQLLDDAGEEDYLPEQIAERTAFKCGHCDACKPPEAFGTKLLDALCLACNATAARECRARKKEAADQAQQTMIRCGTCNDLKPVVDFGKRAHLAQCKPCNAQVSKESRQRAKEAKAAREKSAGSGGKGARQVPVAAAETSKRRRARGDRATQAFTAAAAPAEVKLKRARKRSRSRARD